MKSLTLAIVAAILSAIIYGSFFIALDKPFSTLHLPLIIIVTYIISFRFSEAIAVALTGGLILDTLSAGSFGVHILMMTLITLSLFPLFTHIFTNRSLAGFIGMNISAFILFMLFNLLFRTIHFWIAGYPLNQLFQLSNIQEFGGNLLFYILSALAFRALISFIKRTLLSFIFIH